jgi:hypothetical protein
VLAVVIVNLGIAAVYLASIRPADFNHVGPFPAEEFLAEPDMNCGRGRRDHCPGRRLRTFDFSVGAG